MEIFSLKSLMNNKDVPYQYEFHTVLLENQDVEWRLGIDTVVWPYL